jgi:DNA-binding MarR family transcriptional regulator
MLITESRSTKSSDQVDLRKEASELADYTMQLQRRLLYKLSEELGHGSVSFPQFFILTYLAKKGVITMSAIAERMGHTTAAATGLVDRLEKMGYAQRTHAIEDRRKVMVRITKSGNTLVDRIRQDMVDKITTLLEDHLSAEEGRAWLQIYRKITDYCETLSRKA